MDKSEVPTADIVHWFVYYNAKPTGSIARELTKYKYHREASLKDVYQSAINI